MGKELLCAVASLVLITVGCSSQDGVRTTLDEYEIDTAPTSARAGRQRFEARNEGEIAHQLFVLRTDRDADDLPVKKGVVRTDAKGIDVVGEIELIAAGASAAVSVDLRKGSYVLICNIAGHYTSGMHAPFSVR